MKIVTAMETRANDLKLYHDVQKGLSSRSNIIVNLTHSKKSRSNFQPGTSVWERRRAAWQQQL